MRNIWYRVVAAAGLAAMLAACSSPQQRETKHLQRGSTYFADRDYPRALAEFRDAAQAMPADAEPYYRQALVHLAAGDFRLAVGGLQHAIELNPKHAQAQLKLAELMTTSTVSRDVREAKSRIEEFLKSYPDDMEAISALAAADWKLGLAGDAEGHLKRALEKFPQNLRARALLAKVHVLNKDLASAETLLKQAAVLSPRSIPVLMAAAEFYSATGNAAEAESYFRRVLEVQPNHADALMDLAALHKALGRASDAEEIYRRLANSSDPKYRILHAVYLLDSGRATEATPELERFHRQNAGDRGLCSLLVSAYVAAGRTADADRIVTEALVKNPKDVDAFFQRSVVRLHAGRVSEAQADLSMVLGLQPGSAQSHFLQAIIHQRSGALQAEQHELAETLRLNPALMGARIELARLLVHNGVPKGAIELLDDAPAAQKKTAALIAQRNWALFAAADDMPQLRKGIEAGLAVSRTPDLLVQDALFHLQQGHPDQSQHSIDEVLKSNPGYVRALILWARILSKRGSAAARLRAYAAAHPASAQVQQFYGEFALSTGNREEAKAAFQRAKASQPDFVTPDFSLAQMAIQDGQTGEARRLLMPLLSGAGSARAHLMMAAVEQMSGNVPEAIRHFRAVVAVDAGNVSALNDLAFLLVETGGSAEEALKYAQQAKELAPHDPNVEDTLGWVMYHRGMYSAALEYLQDSVARENAAATNLHLAMTYAKIGDLAAGRRFLEVARRQKPDLPGLTGAKQILGVAN
jgi:tetratricopeptide (TPR) repeat protein